MLTAIIPREDTTAVVIRDIMEMERIANQVSQQSFIDLEDVWETFTSNSTNKSCESYKCNVRLSSYYLGLYVFFSPTTSLSSLEAKVLKLVAILQNKLSVLFCITSHAQGISYSSFVPFEI